MESRWRKNQKVEACNDKRPQKDTTAGTARQFDTSSSSSWESTREKRRGDDAPHDKANEAIAWFNDIKADESYNLLSDEEREYCNSKCKQLGGSYTNHMDAAWHQNAGNKERALATFQEAVQEVEALKGLVEATLTFRKKIAQSGLLGIQKADLPSITLEKEHFNTQIGTFKTEAAKKIYKDNAMHALRIGMINQVQEDVQRLIDAMSTHDMYKAGEFLERIQRAPDTLKRLEVDNFSKVLTSIQINFRPTIIEKEG